MSATRDFRNRRFWKSFATHLFSALGALAAVLTIISVFFINALSKVGWWLFLLVGAVAFLYAIKRSYPRPIKQRYSMPDTTIRLVTGDLFSQNTSLVVGMSDCFDVETPHIIRTDSVQGQLLHNVYKGDTGKLQSDLKTALAAEVPIETNIAKDGNTDRYECGTVAAIRHHRTYYYCVAYTKMDEHNKASSTIGILWDAMEKLWREVRRCNNGEAVSVPIIGLGQSGLSTVLPIQDAIRFLILTFMFASRQERVCDELRIVVRPEDENRVNMLEVQDFLTSLKKS
ncbi:macro domain-containing protein [Kineococcus sp. SYSU DK005]|uniref:macro domain-containing protein n=1 Tax=Kineococcus sp. SYSU DK005 TaxID=3383126 RepID=UPI003D7D533E